MNEEQHERAGLCGPSFESARRRRLRHSEKRRGIVFLNVAAGHAPHSALWPRLTHSHALGPGRAGPERAIYRTPRTLHRKSRASPVYTLPHSPPSPTPALSRHKHHCQLSLRVGSGNGPSVNPLARGSLNIPRRTSRGALPVSARP